VLIILAVTLPVLLLFSSFALDTANWWVHKRHLQIQADAGALAAAKKFRFPICDAGVNSDITATANQYAGISGTPVYNTQIGQNQQVATGDNDVPGAGPTPTPPTLPPRGVHMQLNSPSFHGRPATIIDPELVGSPSPCTSKMVDVKMTETGVPWFFRAAGVPYIDARARVAIETAETLSGLLPVGVENVNPTKIHVWLVDEDSVNSDTVLAQADLGLRGVTAGLPYWDNAVGRGSGPMVHNVQAQRIGVRIAMAGSSSATFTGSYATVCAQPLVVCRPDPTVSALRGVARVRGYSTATGGTGLATVRLRQVTLSPPSGCAAPANGYFSTTCANVQLRAKLDGVATNATVKATIEQTNQSVTLTYDAATQTFFSPVANPLPFKTLGAGAYHIDIDWAQNSGCIPAGCPSGSVQCTNGNNTACKSTFSNVQSAFSGSRPSSGPVKALAVSATALPGVPPGADGNNIPSCTTSTGCEQAFVVEVGVGGNLALGAPSDPPVSLRVFGGSQNQSLDCDPANQTPLDTEIATGCAPEYAVNHGTACPANPGTLWASPSPWNCVAIATGTNTNAPASGLNQRVYGVAKPGNIPCPPSGANHWPTWPDGDKRLMDVFIVPFGSFDGSGNGTVPVTGFASFYVTGWTANGQGFQNPCQGFGDAFEPGTENDNGAISGHFHQGAGSGTGSGQPCDFASIETCVAVLVK
jgi:hypothetical protein